MEQLALCTAARYFCWLRSLSWAFRAGVICGLLYLTWSVMGNDTDTMLASLVLGERRYVYSRHRGQMHNGAQIRA